MIEETEVESEEFTDVLADEALDRERPAFGCTGCAPLPPGH
jgi:hypothetical protein